MRFRRFACLTGCISISILCTFLLFAGFRDSVKKEKLSVKPRKPLNLVEKSVFIRYGNTDELSLFSAYLYPSGITVILSSYGYFGRKVYCRYFDALKKEIGEAYGTIVFPEFTVNCSHVSTAVYIGISINKHDDCSMIQVTHRTEKPGNKFAVCLAPIFGSDPKWLMLLEFIEYYKLQGSDYFYVYNMDSNEETRKILEYYEKKGHFEVIQLKNTTNCMKRHRCRHEMQLQECLSRARFHSQWVATVDLDERLYIYSNDGAVSIRDWLSSVNSVDIGEHRFRCRWILRYEDIPEECLKAWDRHLPMRIWTNTSHVAPLNHTTKSIIDPTKVESMGVHQVMRFSQGAKVNLVEPQVAVVRHYRLQKGWSFFLKEAEEFGEFTNTTVYPQIMERLRKSIQQRISDIFNVK